VAKAAQRSGSGAKDLGIGRGFEVAAIPALFGFVGMAVKLWIGYDAEMNAEQQRMAWRPGQRERTSAETLP
jgi:hypothetical protein